MFPILCDLCAVDFICVENASIHFTQPRHWIEERCWTIRNLFENPATVYLPGKKQDHRPSLISEVSFINSGATLERVPWVPGTRKFLRSI